MNVEDEIIELKNSMRMLEVKLQSVMNLLAKEGMVRRQDMDEEYKELLNGKDG